MKTKAFRCKKVCTKPYLVVSSKQCVLKYAVVGLKYGERGTDTTAPISKCLNLVFKTQGR